MLHVSCSPVRSQAPYCRCSGNQADKGVIVGTLPGVAAKGKKPMVKQELAPTISA